MKKLKKILLINWLYFSKQLIEVDDINFLTGKTGAGKSTIIDALQIVLLGELNARNFNKAANESSQRTLDGYLRADMDVGSIRSRRGKDFASYIACEFWDDLEHKCFVAGIVFECHSDGSRQERFFMYNGVIPPSCFLENQQAMDIAALRGYLKALPGTRAVLYDSHKQYRADLLAKWNVHNEQVCRMLKKAVSFRPIVDIQQFITENICDVPDKPDIEAMQQNIRDYKRHEQLAQRQEEKLAALKDISRLFHEMRASLDRLRLQRFLTLWAEKEDLTDRITKCEAERDDCEKGIQRLAANVQECDDLIAEKSRRKDELIADRAKDDIYQEQNRLRDRRQQLEQEQNRLQGQLIMTALEVKKEAQDLCRLCQRVLEWPQMDVLLPLRAAAQSLYDCYSPLCDCTVERFSGSLKPFEEAQTAASAFSAQLRDSAYQIENLMAVLYKEKEENEVTLEKLRLNIKDYPKGLLALKERLERDLTRQLHRAVSVQVLADALEIAEGQEAWRGAVEGYLNTQKFYLLVEPQDYSAALALYDNIKNEYGRQSFGLVDVGKLREKERLETWNDSLSKKIETTDPLARDYIDYLLGHVACCTHIDQLRRHRTAITADGMLYQNYVARPIPRERMEDAFIGRKSIALRVERLQAKQNELLREIEKWSPLKAQLERHKNREYVLSLRFVQVELVQRQQDYLGLLETQQELSHLEEKLAGLDLLWITQMNTEIESLAQAVKDLSKKSSLYAEEKGQLTNRLDTLLRDVLPELKVSFEKRNGILAQEFDSPYQQTVGLPRYEQELSRLKRASIIMKNFGDRLQQTRNEMEGAQDRLFRSRGEYVRNFQPCSFRIETMENGEFDEERRMLEESELPRYRDKILKARESALEQFQNDFLAKLKSSIDQVQDQVKNLNKVLKHPQFGTERYQFRVERNPDYASYYDMIMSPMLMEGEGGLLAIPFQQKFGPLIEDLFSRIAASDDTQLNPRKHSELQQNIERYTDFRTYLKFDLETTDQNGSCHLLSQTLNTKSGGETQTPFYIAVVASFAQLYQVNSLSSVANNTSRLVLFDEAFNKMDSERIIESVRLLRKMKLQAIICAPPDKLPDIMPEADRTFLVSKEKYQMHILPYRKEIE